MKPPGFTQGADVRRPSAWSPPSFFPPLPPGEVHVWRARLDAPGLPASHYLELLSIDERERAARCCSPLHRRDAIVSRGMLRLLLARYLDSDPGQLRFEYGPNGKPALAGGFGALVRFNLSHSHNLALYAVTAGADVGIDLERVRPSLASERVADRFFAPEEAAALKLLPSASRPAAFFACWTRKEALLKAKGGRIGEALRGFQVSLDPDEESAALRFRDAPEESDHWSIVNLSPGRGWAAALAVEGLPREVRCWQWGRQGGQGSRGSVAHGSVVGDRHSG